MDTKRKIDDFVNLWRMVYEDDEQSVRWYCKHILNDGKDIVSIYENDICMAILSLPAVKFNYEGHEVEARFITNFAINPDYRHNNYELDLLFYAIHYLFDQGVALVCGYPISKQLKILYQRRWHVIVQDTSVWVHALRSASQGAFDGMVVEKTKRNIESEYNALIKTIYRNYVVHPSSAFDYMALEGEFFMTRDAQGIVRGIAICLHYNEEHVVAELVADCNEAKHALIDAVCEAYNWEYIDYSCYDSTSHDGAGFLRVVNFQKMLDVYAKVHPEFKDSFNIVDQNAILNTGSYLIENGECRLIEEDDTLRTIGMAELHSLLFKAYHINLKAIY